MDFRFSLSKATFASSGTTDLSAMARRSFKTTSCRTPLPPMTPYASRSAVRQGLRIRNFQHLPSTLLRTYREHKKAQDLVAIPPLPEERGLPRQKIKMAALTALLRGISRSLSAQSSAFANKLVLRPQTEHAPYLVEGGAVSGHAPCFRLANIGHYEPPQPVSGKTHLAIAITTNVVRAGAQGRYFNTVDLVPRLEEEARIGKSGALAAQLSRLDLVVLDELGYLPFARSGGQLLLHLVSKLYEQTSVIITTEPDVRGMAHRVRRSQDDHCSPRSRHPSLRHHRDRQ